MTDPLVPGPAGPCQAYADIDDLVKCNAYGGSDDDAGDFIIDASEILYILFGRSLHGICTATIQTDPNHCTWWMPDRDWLYPADTTRLGLTWSRDIIKLEPPVVSITSVTDPATVGGTPVTLDPATYQLMDGTDLVKVDRSWWVGPTTITYSFGAPIPSWARDACVELALELWKDRCGQSSCFGPNVTSVQRQGINLNLDRRVDEVRTAGPTLPKVMAAMAIINPTNQRSQAEVWSPDDPNPTHAIRLFS